MIVAVFRLLLQSVFLLAFRSLSASRTTPNITHGQGYSSSQPNNCVRLKGAKVIQQKRSRVHLQPCQAQPEQIHFILPPILNAAWFVSRFKDTAVELLTTPCFRRPNWKQPFEWNPDPCRFSLNDHCVSPPSLSLARCVWKTFVLLWPVLSACLFSGLSDLRSILQGGVTSEESRIFSCRWSPPGWLLDEYLRVCRRQGDKSNVQLQQSGSRWLACAVVLLLLLYLTTKDLQTNSVLTFNM